MRLLLMSLLCLLSFYGFSQESEEETQGQIVVGGSLNFNTQNNDQVKTSNFSFAPSVGYEKGNWMLGGNLIYSRLNSDIGTIGTYRTTVLGGGIFARYTVAPQKKLSFFLQPYAQYSYSENFSTSSENPVSGSFHKFEFGLSPGLRYDITPKIRVLARLGGVGYSRIFNSNDPRVLESSGFNASCRFNGSNFGFEIKF